MRFILKLLAGAIVLAIAAFGVFFYSAQKSAQRKARMIEELAAVKPGSTVDEVMSLAQELGFMKAGEQFAVPAAIEMTNDDAPVDKNHLPVAIQQRTDVANLKNGKLNFGLSLFLFSRSGCEITFKDGKVIGTRVWSLD